MKRKPDRPVTRSEKAQASKGDRVCFLKPGERLREGMRCPRCKQGIIAYNGMLHLVCPHCGLTEAGACT